MPTTRRSRPAPRSGSALLVLLLSVTGCGLLGGEDEGRGRGAPPAATGPTGAGPPDVVSAIEDALAHRARALREGNRRAFEAGLARDPALREAQGTYFDNLRQLPLAVYELTADPATLVRDGRGYWVEVDVALQLRGYDAAPVLSRDRYRFLPAPRRGRMRLVSVTDPEWESRHGVRDHPWDTGPVVVRTGPGVLAVFDPDSVRHADEIVSEAASALGDVSASVPYPWSLSVVLYAISDTAFLSSLGDVPGRDPEDHDGVAFRVDAAPGGAEVATRVALHPRVLDDPGPARERLLRHEVTHVALGPRDDHAPLWLREGLAEYVAARPVPFDRRRPPERVMAAARAGFPDLPTARDFNGEDPTLPYAVSWWACEYLVAASGSDAVLWTLLDAFAAPVDSAAGVLEATTGLRPRRLARAAATHLVTTFAPPLPPPAPATTAPPTPGGQGNTLAPTSAPPSAP